METVRKVLAVLIALRGLTNFAKPFQGRFVILGRLMEGGLATTVVAPLVGVAIVAYAYGLWHARPWARPLGIAFGIWATLNAVLFPIFEPEQTARAAAAFGALLGLPRAAGPWMYVFFAVPGIVAPWLAVWLLVQRRA